MNDYRNIKLYSSAQHHYELVWFEDKKSWFICCTDRGTEEQTYSQEGYDNPQQGALAFEGRVTYVAEPPGKS